MKLYCTRHGEACGPEVDPNCGLTDAGRQAIENLGRHLVNCGVEISHIVHSTKLRAKQTAEILGKALKSEHINECEAILDAEAPLEPIVNMLQAWDQDTMIVGHLPFMNKLVSKLVVQDEFFFPIVNYSPGTIVCLEYYESGRWLIKWSLQPSIVTQSSR